MTTRMCPNCCTSPVADHPDNGCALAVLIQVIRERGDLTERKLRDLHYNCNVDHLWDRLGPVIDDLQAGEFTP